MFSVDVSGYIVSYITALCNVSQDLYVIAACRS